MNVFSYKYASYIGLSILWLFVVFSVEIVQCPEGFHRYQNHCFYVPSYKGNYEESREICRAKDSILADINRDSVQIILSEFLRTSGIPHAWIGLKYDPKLKQWMKENGNILYTNGYFIALSGEGTVGNLTKVQKSCMELTFKGHFSLWFEQPCSKQYQALCRPPGKSFLLAKYFSWPSVPRLMIFAHFLLFSYFI